MSNLLEFGGKANVILRAICDFEVNGNAYKADDVVFCFEDVDVQFTYNETIKDKTVGGYNIMAYDERKLNAMIIDSTPLTTDFIELFATQKRENFARPVIETMAIAEGKFYPTHTPASNKIYITNLGQYEFTMTALDDAGKFVECQLAGEIPVDSEYYVIYDTLVEKPTFDINNNYTLPYFKAQIIGVGNVDKQTGYAFFEIPRVSLLTRPDYSMDRTITAQGLQFKIISDRSDSSIEIGVY
jgi:hypothetical protein